MFLKSIATFSLLAFASSASASYYSYMCSTQLNPSTMQDIIEKEENGDFFQPEMEFQITDKFYLNVSGKKQTLNFVSPILETPKKGGSFEVGELYDINGYLVSYGEADEAGWAPAFYIDTTTSCDGENLIKAYSGWAQPVEGFEVEETMFCFCNES